MNNKHEQLKRDMFLRKWFRLWRREVRGVAQWRVIRRYKRLHASALGWTFRRWRLRILCLRLFRLWAQVLVRRRVARRIQRRATI
jgi:hypothetical protein